MTYMWPQNSPYNYRIGQQVPGQSLYYAPREFMGSTRHEWSFTPEGVTHPTTHEAPQAMRLSNENFMMARPGSSGPRALGSAYTPATAGNQSQALRRRR